MKRAVAKFTVYVYGEDDHELFNEAKRIERKVLDLDDNHATLTRLVNAPTGTIDPDKFTDIDISKMSLPEEL